MLFEKPVKPEYRGSRSYSFLVRCDKEKSPIRIYSPPRFETHHSIVWNFVCFSTALDWPRPLDLRARHDTRFCWCSIETVF